MDRLSKPINNKKHFEISLEVLWVWRIQIPLILFRNLDQLLYVTIRTANNVGSGLHAANLQFLTDLVQVSRIHLRQHSALGTEHVEVLGFCHVQLQRVANGQAF